MSTYDKMAEDSEKILQQIRGRKHLADTESRKEQAAAWELVSSQLLKHNPKMYQNAQTGQEDALNEIKRLQYIETNLKFAFEKVDAWDKLMDVFERLEPNASYSTYNDVVPIIENWYLNRKKVGQLAALPRITPTTDRDWLIECLITINACKNGPIDWSTFAIKLQNYLILNEEQFAKPKDYGKLLAFADRVSEIIWGGECAWSSLEDAEMDGLKTLSSCVQKTVKELNDKVKKEAVLLTKLRAANYTIDEYLNEAEDTWDEDENDEDDAEGIYMYEDDDYEDDEDK